MNYPKFTNCRWAIKIITYKKQNWLWADIETGSTLKLKVGLPYSKEIFVIRFNGSPKNDEKCFLFYLKSSFLFKKALYKLKASSLQLYFDSP